MDAPALGAPAGRLIGDSYYKQSMYSLINGSVREILRQRLRSSRQPRQSSSIAVASCCCCSPFGCGSLGNWNSDGMWPVVRAVSNRLTSSSVAALAIAALRESSWAGVGAAAAAAGLASAASC